MENFSSVFFPTHSPFAPCSITPSCSALRSLSVITVDYLDGQSQTLLTNAMQPPHCITAKFYVDFSRKSYSFHYFKLHFCDFFLHFLGAACIGALFFLRFLTSIVLQPCRQQAKPPLRTAENAGDCLGYYLLVLQQDQAELGLTLSEVQTSCVCRNGIAI